MRLIDADKMHEQIEGTGYHEVVKSNMHFMVRQCPTIDAVEVVRCETFVSSVLRNSIIRTKSGKTILS